MRFVDNDPVMTLINENLSYKERQRVLEVISESPDGRNKVYGKIGKFILNKIDTLAPGAVLTKYLNTNGDITKLKGYENMIACLGFLKAEPHKDLSGDASIVEQAVLNLKSRRKVFELGCRRLKNPLMKLFYGTMTKAVVAATSLLISNSMTVGGRNRYMVPTVIVGLASFNKYCKDGTVDKLISYTLYPQKFGGGQLIHEDVDLFDFSIDAFSAIGSALITAIRNTVYWVYYARTDLADYLEQQAEYLEINKLNVENRSDLTAEEKKKIIDSQEKSRKQLLELSDAIQLDEVKAARRAKDEANKDDRDFAKSNPSGKSDDSQTDGGEIPDFF